MNKIVLPEIHKKEQIKSKDIPLATFFTGTIRESNYSCENELFVKTYRGMLPLRDELAHIELQANIVYDYEPYDVEIILKRK